MESTPSAVSVRAGMKLFLLLHAFLRSVVDVSCSLVSKSIRKSMMLQGVGNSHFW
jgi:hypothetical protein